MTLRTVHLIFVLAVVIVCDLFGAWAVHEHGQRGGFGILMLGIMSFVVGFAAIAYAIGFVRKLDQAKIE